MRRPLLIRSATAALCLLACAVMLQAFRAHPLRVDRLSFAEFRALKLAQPVVRPDERRTLLAGGDVMLSRYVDDVIARSGSIDHPFRVIGDAVRGSDVAFANLENPAGTGAWEAPDDWHFRMETELLESLKNAGFDALSLANNHMSDAGTGSVSATIALLDAAGIRHVGAGRTIAEAHAPLLLDMRGITVAFLAYADPRFGGQVDFATENAEGVAKAEANAMREDVLKARAIADVVVISLHAGIEYLDEPDAVQRTLLDAAADAGADIVLGHHPHVIQPLEKRGDAWTIASLGNLVFDQMWSDAVRRGMMLRFLFDGSTVREIEALPILMHDYAQPRGAAGESKRLALASLKHPLHDATVTEWTGPDRPARVALRAMPLQEPRSTAFTIEKTMTDDIDDNGRHETYALREGRLIVTEEYLPLWESDNSWWVQDAFLADTDGDGRRELLLSVWKSGDYGRSKPFWVTHNDPSVRHHVFLFERDGATFVPRWQSSNLPHPNCAMAFADLDGDGEDELIALEGDYTEDGTCAARFIAVWKRGMWGFSNEWRSKEGAYWNLRTETSGPGAMIVVNGKAD